MQMYYLPRLPRETSMSDDLNTLQALLILAGKAAQAGQPQAAETIYRRSVQTAEITFGMDDAITALTLVFLNEHLIERCQAEEVRANRQRIVGILTVYRKTQLLSAPITAVLSPSVNKELESSTVTTQHQSACP